MSTNVRKLRTAKPVPASDPLGSALFAKTRLKVLGWLFTHPDQSFYVRELVKAAGAAQGAISSELRDLTKAGIIRRTVRGRQVFYQADETSPIYPELKALFVKIAGLTTEIRTALEPLRASIPVAFIYGSAARGELHSGSDIDLIVVGDASFGELVHQLANAQQSLGREINPSVYTPREFHEKIRAGHHFLTSILREPKIFIFGGPREFERMAKVRVAGATSNKPARDRRPVRHRRSRSR